MRNRLDIINYDACAGLGVIFPAKSFIYEGDKFIFIISPANFNEQIIDRLQTSGKELIFISPNNFHNLHLRRMKELFPAAKFYGPKRSANESGVELKKMKEFHFEEMIAIQINGNNALSETLFYIPSEKVLIVTDLFFNMHHKMNLSTVLAMLCAGTYKKLGTSRIIKFSTKDTEAFKNSCMKSLDHDFAEVIPSHGDTLTRGQFEDYLEKLF